ncbi:hypothetical protein HYFRA_00004037 [Hymenoscyphus fraxineus]|uniref:Uncharacterized protein n=1 Tax=Hymenoscyphus fraxineus TaxID=746836 RepID=A0A9N9KLX0_9HELO|nr:hypothetical protein HYFRA_00004037 [Hymenoscyphus fraxineus]
MLPHSIIPSCSPWKLPISRGLPLQLIPARPYVSKPGAPKRPSRFGDKHISLDHFLLRGRVVSLYRDIIRGCRRITNPSSKKEMIDMARRRSVIYFLPEEHSGKEWNGILTDYDHGNYMLSEF